MIRRAKKEEIKKIYQLSIKAKKQMISQGLNQWVGNYPPLNQFESDYKKKGLYVYIDKERIIGSISILPENDIAYQELKWLSTDALVIHRLFVDPEFQYKGIGKELFIKALELGKTNNKNIKVDTHPDNLKMQNLILKMQFKYIGYLQSINRLAYEYNI